MVGALKNQKFIEDPGYDGEFIKGYVTGLHRNYAGIYLFDVAAARAAQHNKIAELLREPSKQVNFIGRTGLQGAPVLIRFEAQPYEVFKVELETFDDFDPPMRDSEEVADALWYAVNQSLGIYTDVMLAELRIHSDDRPMSGTADRKWARTIEAIPTIKPTSYQAVVDQYLS